MATKDEAVVRGWTEVEHLLECKVEVPVPADAKDVPQGSFQYTFEEALQRRITLDAAIKEGQGELKALNDALLVEMRAADVQKVGLWDGMTFEVRTGASASKIDATKLLEAGVPVETIDGATIPGKQYQYVQVNKSKAREHAGAANGDS